MTVAASAQERKKREGAARAPKAEAADLLAWYDRHARVLPWRAKPGERADPYRVWLSEIMLQQTTVTAVMPYYARFLQRFPDIHALARAPLDDVLKAWAGLGYYARGRNLHACAKAVVERHGATLPRSEQALAALPGIGPYTAAAIAAIAYDLKASPVDGNVERVISRIHAVEAELPVAKPAIRALAAALTPDRRPGDFAQAMMDLGATICTPQKPACALCPWMEACAARRRGDADTFPRKAAKKEGRLRRGAAFVVIGDDGRLLVRTRPARGLLGGMTEVPGSAWSHDFDVTDARESAPAVACARWRRLPGTVTHVFTHFPLELVVFLARVPAATPAPVGMRWVGLDGVAGEALPNVMRKVLAHALPARRETPLPPPRKRSRKPVDERITS